jgi:hypothetical protein
MEIKCLLESVTEKEQIKSDLENRIAVTESAIAYMRRELTHQREKEENTNNQITKISTEIQEFEKLLFQCTSDLESEKSSCDNVQMTTENMANKLSTLSEAARCNAADYEIRTTEISNIYETIQTSLKANGNKWKEIVQSSDKTLSCVKQQVP